MESLFAAKVAQYRLIALRRIPSCSKAYNRNVGFLRQNLKPSRDHSLQSRELKNSPDRVTNT